jgi:membrane-bound serine protease (ClpP class)
MHRRTVQEALRTSSTGSRRAVRGTVAKAGAALVTAAVALLALGATASTASCEPGSGPVSVIEVEGLVDPVLADFVADQIDAAADACAVALVLQLDSGGVTIGDDELDELVRAVERSEVPVDVWIGPSGSTAAGDTVRIVAAAEVTGMAPGSTIEVTPALLGAAGVEPTELGTVDVGDRVNAERAVELGLVDNDAPIIGEFVVGLTDQGVETRVVGEGDQRRTEPVTPVAFGSLGVFAELMHTVASPAVAYLLFVIGLGLLLFELYTAGVGVAGMVGAGSLVLGCYGLATLPTRPIGVALLLFAMFAYGVDVQTGVPRVWTAIGSTSFVLGSLVLFDGLSVSWVTLVFAIVGMTLAMLAGMPAMVRSRFSTPTIGREWMIGELGEARTDIDPDGVVTIRDAPWRARTNRATPIRAHEPARVVSIEGLLLEVEPEEGGARDYRDRGGRGS